MVSRWRYILVPQTDGNRQYVRIFDEQGNLLRTVDRRPGPGPRDGSLMAMKDDPTCRPRVGVAHVIEDRLLFCLEVGEHYALISPSPSSNVLLYTVANQLMSQPHSSPSNVSLDVFLVDEMGQ